MVLAGQAIKQAESSTFCDGNYIKLQSAIAPSCALIFNMQSKTQCSHSTEANKVLDQNNHLKVQNTTQQG